MIKVEKIDVWGFEHAIRGMRNPMNSWDKSDTIYGEFYGLDENGREILVPYNPPQIGKNDLDLMKRLYKAGTEHRKYLRQIFVSMDITAPLYWWKEFDTYKVGTTANSCSTMHKIAAKEFELDDFSHEHLLPISESVLDTVIRELNSFRGLYLTHKDKEHWWQLIQLLPSSYNQKRTVTFTYENVMTMIRQRTGHKLDEWRNFVEILHGLPYVAEITGE
jgi:hypothetical protein